MIIGAMIYLLHNHHKHYTYVQASWHKKQSLILVGVCTNILKLLSIVFELTLLFATTYILRKKVFKKYGILRINKNNLKSNVNVYSLLDNILKLKIV